MKDRDGAGIPIVRPVRFDGEEKSIARPVRSSGPTLATGTIVEVYVGGRPVRGTVLRLESSDLIVGRVAER